MAAPFSFSKTVPVTDVQFDADKIAGIIMKQIDIDPTVGFVICVEEPHHGDVFRRPSDRSSEMDVSLPDDEAVSHNAHAEISFDSRRNTFLLFPVQSREITYLNVEPTETAVKLNVYAGSSLA